MRPIFDRFRDYDFQFWVTVQAESGDPAKVHRLFGVFGTDDRNKWFDARQRRHEVAGYISDLAIASNLADAAASRDAGNRAKAIGLQVRYALISTTLRELAYHHSPALAAHYLLAKVWTGDEAMTWARLNGSPVQALETAVAMLRMSTADARPELWAEALELGGAIGDSDNKVLGIAAFAGDLPPYLQMRALELIKAEKNEGSRLGGLTAFIDKPNISLRILEEALEVAKGFEQDEFRSEALAAVGNMLREPERTRAFQEAIDLLRRGLRKPQGRDRWTSARLARWLPLSMVSDLIADPVFEAAQDALTLEYIGRKTKSDPLEAFSRLKDVSSHISDDLFERLADALASAQLFEEAIFCLKSISHNVLEKRARAIGHFLPLCPPRLRSEAVSLLKDLRSEDQIVCLRELALAPSASKDLMQQVADAILTERNKNEVRAAMGRFLAPDELEVLVQALAKDRRWSSGPFADLAPHLPIELVRFGLNVTNGAVFRDGYIALLIRLANLGHPQEAIDAAAASHYHPRESLEALAPRVSENAIGAIAASIRPDDISERVDLAKVALLPSLCDVDACQNLCERHPKFSVLTALVGKLPPAQLVHVYPLLIDEMRRNMTNESGIERELPQTIGLLCRAFGRLPQEAIIQQVLVEMASEKVDPALKLDLLLQVAEACDDETCVRIALREALTLANVHAEPDAYLNIGMRVAGAHPGSLGSLLEAIDDPGALAPFLALSSYQLDPSTRQRALERVAAIAEPWARLQALRSLWRYLDEEQRRWLAVKERAKPEWLADDQLFVWLWIMLSSSNLEDIAGPEIERARLLFGAMPVREKVDIACWIADVTLGYQEYFESAFAGITSLEPHDKMVAIYCMAPWLTAEQVKLAYRTLRTIKGEDVTPAICELISRSAQLGAGRLTVEGLEQIEDRSDRSGIINQVVELLPLEALETIAFAASRDGIWSYLRTGTLVNLALRAVELGHDDLALTFLEIKGNNSSSSDRPIEEVYRRASPSSYPLLLERSRQIWPGQRSSLLASLLEIAPAGERMSLFTEVIDNLPDASPTKRVEILNKNASEFEALSHDDIIGMWTKTLQRCATKKREDVLSLTERFAPILIARFGPSVASELMSAFSVGARAQWP